MHGFPIRHPSAVLEEVGIAASGPRVDGQRRIYVAGDVIAGRPRTALEAVRSGLRAANAVLADRP
jgi:pyruvate/2-oxoglutarate dehydrogenase complex dihydrolipoamide dehydrogenase (E3) component